MMKSIGIAVPCYNEELTIRKFYRATEAVFHAMPGYQHQYLFIDDGSDDQTLAILRQLHREDPEHVHYIAFSRHFGEEPGIVAGLSHLHTDYTAKMDADLQDPPGLLPKMAHYLQHGYDCVGCVQVGRHQSKFRAWLSQKFYQFFNHMASIRLMPNVRDFRLMNRQFLNSFLQLNERDRFSKGLMSWVGYRVKFLKFRSRPRSAGKSDWTLANLVQYALEAIFDFSVVPVHVIFYLSGLAGLSSLVLLIISIVRCAMGIPSTVLWLSALLAGLSDLQLFCLGIVGAYLQHIYSESKHRPLYIIKEAK